MPTHNPRLSITLTPEVAAVLRRMSDLAGNSQSAIVGDLLQMSLPVFERVVQGLQAAREIQEGARAEIAQGLNRAQARVEEQLGLAMEHMEEGFRPLLEEAEKVRRRGPRGATAAGGEPARGRDPAAVKPPADPRPVTRGSGAPRATTRDTKTRRRGRV